MPTPMVEMAQAIRAGSRFLVASHVSPDGDAVGAMAAVGHLLAALGKAFTLYNVSGLPRNLDWMNLPGPIETEMPAGHFDWIIALDCGDQRRGGRELEQAMASTPTMVIDHHVANPCWGRLNWVETDRSSTSEMVAELAEHLGQDLSGPLGEAAYVGIVTDTGNFSFDNTSPRCLEMTARIIRQGLRPARVNQMIQNQWSPARLKLWGEVLGAARLYFDGQLGAIRITREQFDRLGASAEDCDGLTNFVLRIKGCKIAMFLRQDTPGVMKLSLRSVSGVDIQPVAAAFGGGGHRCAAGATIQGDLDDVQARLVRSLGHVLDQAAAGSEAAA